MDDISIYRIDGAIHDNTDLTDDLKTEARVQYDWDDCSFCKINLHICGMCTQRKVSEGPC